MAAKHSLRLCENIIYNTKILNAASLGLSEFKQVCIHNIFHPFLGMCGEFSKTAVSPKTVKSGDETCDFCVVIAQNLRDELTANSTQEEFEEVRVNCSL